MTCYRPIGARQEEKGDKLHIMPGIAGATMHLPCGKCLGCKTDRATRWSHRCMHEAATWEANAFLTLTYDDEHLPQQGQLEPRHLQLFLKRLRRYANRHPAHLNSDRRSNIRFFACGEYGETEGRPHYHALLFNCGFPDQLKAGTDLYQSALLARLWDKGHNRIGHVTHASAAYIAQYSLKKDGRGDRVDADGVLIPGPFLRMSLRPAIGLTWLQRYHDDLQNGYLVEGTRRHKLHRYHRNKIKEINPDLAERIDNALQAARLRIPTANETEITRDLRAREKIHQRRKQLTPHRS